MNDDVLNEYLKYSNDYMLPIYCKLFNFILDSRLIPDAWSKGTIYQFINIKVTFATQIIIEESIF